MKQAILCLLLTTCTLQMANACDVCGASSGNQNLGLLPQISKHFAGIQYQHNQFESRHIPLSENQPVRYSREHYNTVQLWGRYCLGQRWQFFAFVPYRYNTTTYYNTAGAIKGIGDATVIANYTFIQTADSSENQLRHRLQGGIGIKAPVGSYRGVSELERMGLPNMQPGTGAWDIPINANYTLRYRDAGINTDASYNITTPNKDNYKYGNRLNLQLSAFYWLSTDEISILPQAGVRMEYALHDYDNFEKKWLNEQTGGYIASAIAGVQLYYKSIGLQLQYSRPINQHYGNGNITARQRIDAGIICLF